MKPDKRIGQRPSFAQGIRMLILSSCMSINYTKVLSTLTDRDLGLNVLLIFIPISVCSISASPASATKNVLVLVGTLFQQIQGTYCLFMQELSSLSVYMVSLTIWIIGLYLAVIPLGNVSMTWIRG